MSYLNPIRLHFSGRFQADPSTVNNDPRHFDNAAFEPRYQQPQKGKELNGWWNPEGSGAFRLVGCTVTTAWFVDGERNFVEARDDRVLGLSIADSGARVAGKLVDLDSEQQGASQIWGLLVRLTDGITDLFSGSYDAAMFSDLWPRATGTGSGGDIALSAFYQSVIGPVTWGDVTGSPFLQALQAAAVDGLLSIKFNVDGYDMTPASGTFTLGRIAGTIGPAYAGEPRHFVIGRQLAAAPLIPRSGAPPHGVYFMPAVVDQPARRIIADFGNSFPTRTPGGPMADLGAVDVGYLDSGNAFHSLGALAYTGAGWYEQTAGVALFPPDRPLTAGELRALRSKPLAVRAGGIVAVQENFEGLHARADNFVYRLDPGDKVEVDVYATRFGVRKAMALVAFADSGGLGGPPGSPAVATPLCAIAFDRKPFRSNVHGYASLTIGSSDPGNPRGYIDGQVYGVRIVPLALDDALKDPPEGVFVAENPFDFVSLLVWSGFTIPLQPAWADVLPILQQYANLYPIMNGLVDLANCEDVVRHAGLLAFALSLPIENPNHMPVTRDLSTAKRTMIVRWLASAAESETSPCAGKARAMLMEEQESAADPREGGKSYSLSNRLGLRRIARAGRRD